MRRVFADTFYFIALLSPNDQAHQKAVEFSDNYEGQIVTTDWIVTELADGMALPATRRKFVNFLDMLRADSDVFIAPLDEDLQEEGLSE